MAEPAGMMACDFLGFSVMDNHFHVVVRNRPDLVAGWSDEEVARRWYRLWLFDVRQLQNGATVPELEWKDIDGKPAKLAGSTVVITGDDAVRFFRLWNVQGWPKAFVVDAKGKLRAKRVRGSVLAEVLNELVP